MQNEWDSGRQEEEGRRSKNIIKKNVNENKAMTKVVIAINGAECERKQGNDEGRHCNNKHYVQNEWDFRTIRISILMGQNVNENKAMTKVVIAIKSSIYTRL